MTGSSWGTRPGFKCHEKPATCPLGPRRLYSVLIGAGVGLTRRVSSFKLPRFLSVPIEPGLYASLSRLLPHLEFNW